MHIQPGNEGQFEENSWITVLPKDKHRNQRLYKIVMVADLWTYPAEGTYAWTLGGSIDLGWSRPLHSWGLKTTWWLSIVSQLTEQCADQVTEALSTWKPGMWPSSILAMPLTEKFEIIYSYTSSAVLYKLKSHFVRCCVSGKVATGNGPKFAAGESSKLVARWQLTHRTSSPHHIESYQRKL